MPYARKRLVDWKGGMAMAAAAFLLAPVGAYTAQFVPVPLLLVLFSIAVLAAAVRMLLFARQPEPETIMSLGKRSVTGALVGAFAGFMGRMLELGGGFIIAPILMWMGYRTKQAAATTAFVVTFSSFSGNLGHVAEGHMNWPLTLVVVAAVIVRSQLGGTFMSTKAKPKWVKQLYALVLVAIAAKLILGVLGS
ncbi:MAG: sulfite exporter TauE/SafE family protein [Gemmatimonadota bacterium]